MFSPVLIHQYLSLSAELYPDKTALICGNERWTYRSLDDTADLLGHMLTAVGLRRHDRVVILMDNTAEAVISIYAILKAGGTFVMLNQSVKAQKLAYILKDSGAKVLITDVSKSKTATEALSDMPSACHTVLWAGEKAAIPELSSVRSLSWIELLYGNISRESELRIDLPLAGESAIDQDLAALIYTSGSTGEPKGVMSSHFNMVSAARSIIKYLENTPEDIILNVLPLSFDYGLYQIIMACMFGGTVILEKSFLFPAKVLEWIPKERVTGFPIVPTIAALLLRMAGLGKFDLSSLRYITNTAAVLPVEHIHRLRGLFAHVKIFSMYGLTECKRVSYLPPGELASRPASVGKPIPNCDAFIADENGREVPAGEVGELVIRGANVMRGYWNSPELTQKVFRRTPASGETLLFSGDLFRKDEEGFLYFVARRDEQIKTKGERVSPNEIEKVLCTIEGIEEAAIIGTPDEIWGQAIKGFIVPTPTAALKEGDILKYCSKHLESFMIPKHIVFLQELPKTANGKVDKSLLRQRF